MHVGLDFLQVGQHIGTLLVIDARHSVKEVALKAQGHGRARLDDLSACFPYIDFLYGLSGNLLGAGSSSNSRDQPSKR